MQPMSSSLTPTFNRWFFLFILFHLLLWTLLPSLVRYHLPMDSIEGALWGHQLEWGYDKNPFVNAWITAFAMKVSNYKDSVIYLMSQLAVVTCFYATWRLAKRIVSPPLAFLSIILLEGIQYYHLHSIDLSDNLLELAAWSLTIYAFYCAVRGSKIAWIWTGLFSGLAMVTKYYSGFLLLSLAIFLLTEKSARLQLRTMPPYLGLMIFTLVIMPHVYWLVTHDYMTISYMLARTDNIPHWSNHFVFPMMFLYEQLLIALPTFLLYGSLFLGRSRDFSQGYSHCVYQSFDKRFLFCAALLPFIFTLLVSFLFNLKLHAGWGSPLMTLWPLALFVFVGSPSLSMTKLRAITGTVIVLMSVLGMVYAYSLVCPTTSSSANFDGKRLAKTLTEEWHQRYHTPLPYVAGSRFLVGSMAYYSPDHPTGWIDWNSKISPWVHEDDVKKRGAIFIFYANDKLPEHLKAQFPHMLTPEVKELAWLRNRHHLRPEKIKVIYVPPSQ